MDESTQLLIFTYGTDENFEITKELAGLCSIQDCTTSKETLDEVIKCVTENLGPTFSNFVSICTDGTPPM
jgi:hypothetical protein